jgi:predicted dehydrogenase
MHDGGDEIETIRPSLPAVSALRAQAENFVAAVRGDREPVADSTDALADLRSAAEYVRERFD